MLKSRLIRSILAGHTFRNLPILDVVAVDPSLPDGPCRIYFARSVTLEQAQFALEGIATAAMTLNGAPILTCSAPPDGMRSFLPQLDLCEGRNTIIGTRNGESSEIALEWIKYHYDHFDVRSVLILDRSRPEQAATFANKIASGLEVNDRPLNVILISADQPLGDPNLPPEAHPYCVPEAPGKDRMDKPNPDPWDAPLAETSIYEILRYRFAARARAILNIDLCDLLYAPSGTGQTTGENPVQSPFDAAVEVPGQAIQLSGQHCYPWRLRKGQPTGFADHVCVQFANPKMRIRWCIAPSALNDTHVLKIRRIANTRAAKTIPFFRQMAIRHPVAQPGHIVDKSSLIESPQLLERAEKIFDHKPIRPPALKFTPPKPESNRTVIVTTMKNEGPFILEWIAYHQAIGVDDFLIYTNDCSDGTDSMLDLLQAKGIVHHRQNPFRKTGLKPQHAALKAADKEPVARAADWSICMDVDEFINVKVGEGRLEDLFQAVGDANMISCTWRLFGNSGRRRFEDTYTIGQFDRCANEYVPLPHQAWGFKTLFRNNGIFRKMGVHRPKGLNPQLWDKIAWVNGSGKPMPTNDYRNAWRSNTGTYGYDLVSLNHYSVRNAESFLVKRDRGRVNHVDRDQGLAYWFRMNNNTTVDTSIMKRIPMMEERLNMLMLDPEIAEIHQHCVTAHRAKIDALKAVPDQATFYETLTSARLEKLSQMHPHFGANVFLAGPECIPDDVVMNDPAEDFVFNVARAETQH